MERDIELTGGCPCGLMRGPGASIWEDGQVTLSPPLPITPSTPSSWSQLPATMAFLVYELLFT